jgi:hypothetical protein
VSFARFAGDDFVLDSLFARPRALVCSCLLTAAGVLIAHPTLAQSIGADVWNMPDLKEQVRAAGVEEDRLAEEDDDVLRRIAIKDAIIVDLIAGRVTLAEATEHFTALNADRPRYLAALREVYPGATDQEKFARNVISFVVARVEPHERAAISSRLETELRQMLAASASH